MGARADPARRDRKIGLGFGAIGLCAARAPKVASSSGPQRPVSETGGRTERCGGDPKRSRKVVFATIVTLVDLLFELEEL